MHRLYRPHIERAGYQMLSAGVRSGRNLSRSLERIAPHLIIMDIMKKKKMLNDGLQQFRNPNALRHAKTPGHRGQQQTLSIICPSRNPSGPGDLFIDQTL